MKEPTKLERYRAFIEGELDAGRPFPTNKQCAEAIGRTGGSFGQGYGLGGRYTYEKQKIKVERGIASPSEITAFRSKDGTYDSGSLGHQQLQIVNELKQRGEFFRA